jgi:hypothetical protein
MKKQFIAETSRLQQLAGIIIESKVLNEVLEPNSEDYFTTKKEVAKYLSLALKAIEDFEDRNAPPGSANLNPDDPDAEYHFSSSLLSDIATELEGFIGELTGPPEEKFDF